MTERDDLLKIHVARHADLIQQAKSFQPGQQVRIIRDHDGRRGRWVGVVAVVIEFDWHPNSVKGANNHPWRVRTSSGSEMYASADMLAHT